jgi:hypothetical protein
VEIEEFPKASAATGVNGQERNKVRPLFLHQHLYPKGQILTKLLLKPFHFLRVYSALKFLKLSSNIKYRLLNIMRHVP